MTRFGTSITIEVDEKASTVHVDGADVVLATHTYDRDREGDPVHGSGECVRVRTDFSRIFSEAHVEACVNLDRGSRGPLFGIFAPRLRVVLSDRNRTISVLGVPDNPQGTVAVLACRKPREDESAWSLPVVEDQPSS